MSNDNNTNGHANGTATPLLFPDAERDELVRQLASPDQHVVAAAILSLASRAINGDRFSAEVVAAFTLGLASAAAKALEEGGGA